MKAIVGKKLGMTQVFTTDGRMIAVTAVEALPNIVVGQRTVETDGYLATILGFGQAKKLTKPLAGQLSKAGVTAHVANLKEVQLTDPPAIGESVTAALFQPGEKVDVSGLSKGKGFAGVIKRHNFHRGPETHGSDHHRAPGSIGSMFPQRVTKGHRLPGHMGYQRVTVKKLEIVEVHPDQHILLIKGAIPGPKGSMVEVKGIANV